MGNMPLRVVNQMKHLIAAGKYTLLRKERLMIFSAWKWGVVQQDPQYLMMYLYVVRMERRHFVQDMTGILADATLQNVVQV